MSASLELVAGYPFRALENQGALKLRIRTSSEASPHDLTWCDVVFAIRPANAAMAALVSEAKRIERIVMCHWDDDLLSIPRASSSYAYFARPGVRRLTLATLLQADVVLSSSYILIQHLQTLLARNGKAHTPALVLPVPALDINPTPFHTTKRAVGGRQCTVGYAGSVDQTEVLQTLIAPALELLWRDGQEIHLQLIGPSLIVSPRWQKFVSNLPVTADYASWLAVRNSLQWDAALAPLPAGHFYRCKFINKYVEFAAAGIPCLFSDVEPFNTIVLDLQNGFLVKNQISSWAAALRLVQNSKVSAQIAMTAQSQVASTNNIDEVSRKVELLLAPWLNYRAPVKKASPYLHLHKGITWLGTNVMRRFF